MALAGLHLVLLDGDIAARHGEARQALHLEALEDVVVDGGLLLGMGDGLLARWIDHDDIGVGPLKDRTLARIEVQRLGDVGRGRRDEFIHRQPAGLDTMRPEKRHPVFQTTGSVRNLGEITKAGTLLLGGKGAMVCRHHLKASCLQACPKAVLVQLVAEGRRHHALRGVIPIRMRIFALVEK